MYDCMSGLSESARVHHALAVKTTSRRAALSHHKAHPHFVFTLRLRQHWGVFPPSPETQWDTVAHNINTTTGIISSNTDHWKNKLQLLMIHLVFTKFTTLLHTWLDPFQPSYIFRNTNKNFRAQQQPSHPRSRLLWNFKFIQERKVVSMIWWCFSNSHGTAQS